jgi:trans-aconitate 2-methyltransferase
VTAAYAFGRDGVAARRLGMVHAVLEPATRALLGEVSGLGPFEAVLDLGCGPGLSTRLLDEAMRPARLVGLDLSEEFLALAQEEVPRGRFLRHDLLRTPWPGGPANLAYARYVLTHLPAPEERVAEWLGQLRPGGLAVLEENEWIDCRQPVFSRYLDVVGDLLTARGHDLYVGRRLAALAAGSLQLCGVRRVSASTAHVAAMFRLNLQAWGAQAPQADDLDRQLADLERSRATGEITWGIRQLVIRRPGEQPHPSNG